MIVLKGADSATPKPHRITNEKIWGVYVAGAAFHVWNQAQVATLAWHGVEGVMPIVVPPQDEKWWDVNYGYAVMEKLVREALAWGVPEGSPLCIDIEEHQSAQMGAAANDISHAWSVACRAHKLQPWTYAAKEYLVFDHWGSKWLAEWPDVTPTDPQLPVGYQGWQYMGDDNGIDLDIFEAGIYMSPDRKVVTLGENKISAEGAAEPVSARGVPAPATDEAGGDSLSLGGTPPATTPEQMHAVHRAVVSELLDIGNRIAGVTQAIATLVPTAPAESPKS